jgi:hypothetical protein
MRSPGAAGRYSYRTTSFLFPLILITIGVVALLRNLNFIDAAALDELFRLWPLLLVLLGVEILVRRTLDPRVAQPVAFVVALVILAAAVVYVALGPRVELVHGSQLVFRGGSSQVAESSAPLDGLQRADLRLEAGGARVSVRAADLPSELYRLSGPYQGVNLDRARETLHVSVSGAPFFTRGRSAELALSNRIPWAIHVETGGSSVSLELRDLPLLGVELSGGASRVTLELPVPTGVVPVEISGGASSLTLSVPRGAAARVTLDGGLSSFRAPSGRWRRSGSTWESSEYQRVPQGDRLEIRVSGGASSVRVTD